jgi:hypothetical protein
MLAKSKFTRQDIFLFFFTIGLITLFTYLGRNFEVDDALIYYRYLQNFISGNGLVYNIGEKFNGLTSPFYTYISIIPTIIFRNVSRVRKRQINCSTPLARHLGRERAG